ncbi:hypothetical protein FIBSPDRAFT_925274 [Athelia psychrophila]|uniref:Uncharacterized protein n=1 Tax=Athelia psychrophila TaxID=1759441 RepID=A0A166V409_9AGAM|nr:hypothetical protein FIBSPDRAFT_925274 [Fibularhizoctonia sp. CBS 109695]
MSTSYSPVDLHSIAVLINYERTSGPMGDYRFRHTKLCDIADSSNTFPSLPWDTIDWFEAGTDDRPKRGFLLRADTSIIKDAPDMPDDMRSSQCSRSVEDLTKEEASTIFWEVRGHNGCYDAISILQNLFLMFPSGQTMRVRAPDGTDFITEVSSRWILEYKLHKPKQATMALVVGDPKQSQSLWTGEGDEMKHSVWEFSNLAKAKQLLC